MKQAISRVCLFREDEIVEALRQWLESKSHAGPGTDYEIVLLPLTEQRGDLIKLTWKEERNFE